MLASPMEENWDDDFDFANSPRGSPVPTSTLKQAYSQNGRPTSPTSSAFTSRAGRSKASLHHSRSGNVGASTSNLRISAQQPPPPPPPPQQQQPARAGRWSAGSEEDWDAELDDEVTTTYPRAPAHHYHHQHPSGSTSRTASTGASQPPHHPQHAQHRHEDDDDMMLTLAARQSPSPPTTHSPTMSTFSVALTSGHQHPAPSIRSGHSHGSSTNFLLHSGRRSVFEIEKGRAERQDKERRRLRKKSRPPAGYGANMLNERGAHPQHAYPDDDNSSLENVGEFGSEREDEEDWDSPEPSAKPVLSPSAPGSSHTKVITSATSSAATTSKQPPSRPVNYATKHASSNTSNRSAPKQPTTILDHVPKVLPQPSMTTTPSGNKLLRKTSHPNKVGARASPLAGSRNLPSTNGSAPNPTSSQAFPANIPASTAASRHTANPTASNPPAGSADGHTTGAQQSPIVTNPTVALARADDCNVSLASSHRSRRQRASLLGQSAHAIGHSAVALGHSASNLGHSASHLISKFGGLKKWGPSPLSRNRNLPDTNDDEHKGVEGKDVLGVSASSGSSSGANQSSSASSGQPGNVQIKPFNGLASQPSLSLPKHTPTKDPRSLSQSHLQVPVPGSREKEKEKERKGKEESLASPGKHGLNPFRRLSITKRHVSEEVNTVKPHSSRDKSRDISRDKGRDKSPQPMHIDEEIGFGQPHHRALSFSNLLRARHHTSPSGRPTELTRTTSPPTRKVGLPAGGDPAKGNRSSHHGRSSPIGAQTLGRSAALAKAPKPPLKLPLPPTQSQPQRQPTDSVRSRRREYAGPSLSPVPSPGLQPAPTGNAGSNKTPDHASTRPLNTHRHVPSTTSTASASPASSPHGSPMSISPPFSFPRSPSGADVNQGKTRSRGDALLPAIDLTEPKPDPQKRTAPAPSNGHSQSHLSSRGGEAKRKYNEETEGTLKRKKTGEGDMLGESRHPTSTPRTTSSRDSGDTPTPTGTLNRQHADRNVTPRLTTPVPQSESTPRQHPSTKALPPINSAPSAPATLGRHAGSYVSPVYTGGPREGGVGGRRSTIGEESLSMSTSMSARRGGELKIPARISMRQGSLKRELEAVKEFANSVEELKRLQVSYQALLSGISGISSVRSQRMSSRSKANMAALQEIDAQYAIWWECAELLIDLSGAAPPVVAGTPIVEHTPSPTKSDKRSPTPVGSAYTTGTHRSGSSASSTGDLSTRQLMILKQMLSAPNPSTFSIPEQMISPSTSASSHGIRPNPSSSTVTISSSDAHSAVDDYHSKSDRHHRGGLASMKEAFKWPKSTKSRSDVSNSGSDHVSSDPYSSRGTGAKSSMDSTAESQETGSSVSHSHPYSLGWNKNRSGLLGLGDKNGSRPSLNGVFGKQPNSQGSKAQSKSSRGTLADESCSSAAGAPSTDGDDGGDAGSDWDMDSESGRPAPLFAGPPQFQTPRKIHHAPSSSTASSSIEMSTPQQVRLALTPENIVPLLAYAKEVRGRLGGCLEDLRKVQSAQSAQSVQGVQSIQGIQSMHTSAGFENGTMNPPRRDSKTGMTGTSYPRRA